MFVNFVLVLIATLLLILLIVLCHLRVVPESKAYVMERLGVYSRTWHTGWHVRVPFVEKKRQEVDLREQILEISNPKSNALLNTSGKRSLSVSPRDSEYDGYKLSECWNGREKNADVYVITKDNIKMGVDIVVFYQITDPRLFVYGHKNPLTAISHLTITTLRNLFGDLELDAALTSRDTVNSKMRVLLDEAADAWGIRITRVEIKDIIPPDGIIKAMEAQMRAERDRRAKVIEAEGIRKAAILAAEGEKQARILIGEGDAERIRLINDANPSHAYLTIKSLEAFAEAATSDSNTIIVPSEIQSIAGLAKSAAEVIKANPKSQADLQVEVK